MTRVSILGLLYCVLGATHSLAQVSHSAAGAAFFRQGKYSEALAEFKEAEREHPKDASIQNLLGITETKLGDLNQADHYYENAIAADPTLLAPHKNLAVNYLTAGRYDTSEEQLKIGLRLNASDPFLHYYLASLYLATSRDREAVEQLEPARSLLENDPSLLFAMTMASLRLHLNTTAVVLIDGCEKRSSLSVGQEYQLAVILTKNKMYGDAVNRFQRIVIAQPDSWISRFDLAIAFLNADQPGQAAPVLEELAHERANDANILSLLGSAYELSGNDQKSLGAYQAAAAADPGNPDRYLDYARLLMDLDRYSEAESIVQVGIANASDAYALDLRQGAIFMLEGQYGTARQSFEKAIFTHPEIALGYFALAQSYMKEGRDHDASEVLENARLKASPDAKICYLQGVVLARLGRNDDAIAALKQSITLEPNIAEPHYEMAKILLSEGLVQPAQVEFEKTVSLAPQHANAFYQLSRIYRKLGDQAKASRMAKQAQDLLEGQRASAVTEQKARLRGFKEVAQQ